MRTPVLIPAYKPSSCLIEIAEGLHSHGVEHLIVVDDGSPVDYSDIFGALAAMPFVHVVRHAVNLGKGAALRTGLNVALVRFPDCTHVVTADADGQHLAEDIAAVAELAECQPGALVLGVRRMQREVPLRSRVGNGTTRVLMRMLIGSRLTDTQTGLRGIPAEFIPSLLRLNTPGYAFELEMLVAAKHRALRIVEHPIQTVYLEGNRSSHFNPLLDSLRIYHVLLRFSSLSALTAVLDNAVFLVAYHATGSIAGSQTLARLAAMTFNYLGARDFVFHSQQRHGRVLLKYVLLVAANGFISYQLLTFLHGRFSVGVAAAKIAAETLLFVANFAIQRDWVFSQKRREEGATDWTAYYSSVPPTANLTRMYTRSALIAAMSRVSGENPRIVELGGANSCFLDAILRELQPSSVLVVDNNSFGLDLLRKRQPQTAQVEVLNASVLEMPPTERADLVFSVGLVEHFDEESTRRAIHAHFDLVRPGGHVVITYPTPTLLYRLARGLLETIGQWKFPDERPLAAAEVERAVLERGSLLSRRVLWPLILTQGMVVARRTN